MSSQDAKGLGPPLCPFGRRAVERILQGGLCQTALHLAESESTNRRAVQETKSGTGNAETPRYPRLVIADRQTAGRGRLGRDWYADAGTLTFSYVDRLDDLQLAEASIPLVALAAGMAVAAAVESFVPPYQTRLKWPNDVYAGGGKIAGVLVESTTTPPRRLVIGIGVNVATDLEQAPAEVRAKARSLAAVTGRSLPRYDLLPGLVECLADCLERLRSDVRGLMQDYRLRCLLTGQHVSFASPQGPGTGRVIGVDDSGGLRIQTDVGECTVRSGEVLLTTTTPSQTTGARKR